MARLTATDVARNFSDVLNRVAGGEEIEITRNGSTVALLKPPRRQFLSPEEFRELMASAPPVDDEFAEDVRRIRAEIGPPPDIQWPS
jgi:prevent-host-death family protein